MRSISEDIAGIASGTCVPEPFLVKLSVKCGGALAHLEAALALAAEIGLPSDHWQIAAEIGRLYQRLGDKQAAGAMFRAASDIGQALAAGIADESVRAQFLNAQQIAISA